MKWIPRILLILSLSIHLLLPFIPEEMERIARLCMSMCLGGLLPIVWREIK